MGWPRLPPLGHVSRAFAVRDTLLGKGEGVSSIMLPGVSWFMCYRLAGSLGLCLGFPEVTDWHPVMLCYSYAIIFFFC